jgi:hypothetical protein
MLQLLGIFGSIKGDLHKLLLAEEVAQVANLPEGRADHDNDLEDGKIHNLFVGILREISELNLAELDGRESKK